MSPGHAESVPSQDSGQLAKPRHVQYWRRCLKTYLPHQYTSNDSSRMTLAFFIVSALDLLGCLEKDVSAAERERYADWIYHCQHPDGGFRGSPGTDLGELGSEDNRQWDPANLPATYFALATLVVLGDDLGRVKRRECLQWLRTMQRQDGSFGETIGEDGRVEGGLDTRFGYCATGVRWILRGSVGGEVLGVPDMDVDRLVHCIRLSEAYDGGISEAPYHEAHAGFTYCAIGALSFLDRLPHGAESRDQDAPDDDGPLPGLSSLDRTVRWLVSRQTATLDEDDAVDTNSDETDTAATCHDAHSFVTMHEFSTRRGELSYKARPASHFDLQWTGFNGRANKIADTCYSFWVMGSLGVLNRLHLIEPSSKRRYLLEKTQHLAGGFGKLPGDPPDLYHSYLGLAAVSLLDEPSLKPIDPAMCVSKDACKHLESLSWRREIVGAGQSEAVSARSDGASATAPIDASYMAISGG